MSKKPSSWSLFGGGKDEAELLLGIQWEVKKLNVDSVTEGGDNIRVFINPKELAVLTRNIRENGLIYPLIVHKKTDDEYEIIDGHRRYRAIKSLGWQSVPCRVCEVPLTREQVSAVMRATDVCHKSWNKYDVAKQCYVELKHAGSMSAAAENSFMSLTQFRPYAMVGGLEGEILGKAIRNKVPFTFVRALADRVVTNALCKKLAMKKDRVVELILDKYIQGKIESTVEFNSCAAKFPDAKAKDIKYWLESDHGLDALKALVLGAPKNAKGFVKKFRKAAAQYLDELRQLESSEAIKLEEVELLKEYTDELTKTVRRIRDKFKQRERDKKKLEEK